MSRIGERFAALRREGKKALITFITAGDPSLKVTADLVLALEDGGADIIELGVPFSDPMADGPVIQASSERALRKGASLCEVIESVGRLRHRTDAPILLMGYFNPIFVMGVDRFCREAKEAGVDGVLVVDLPPEESGPLDLKARAAGIDTIRLLAPTSDRGRIGRAIRGAGGFFYYVSVTGITGGRVGAVAEMKRQIGAIRKRSHLPVAVGFGIRRPHEAAGIARFADGVVIGSVLVSAIAESRSPQRAVQAVGRLIRNFRRSI